VLESHRGWDPGALDLSRHLAERLNVRLLAHHTTRLLVDANRSPGHPRLFSEYTRGLVRAERERIVSRHHDPHWREVRAAVDAGIRASGGIIHVGVHSFVPILDGRTRDVDVGLLYDPGRRRERDIARSWLRAVRTRLPGLRVRANRPYRGVSDGLTTALRRCFPDRNYLGLELEVSQALLRDPDRVVPMADSLAHALDVARARGVLPSS
jgi:predicted N-formylglutamate amidohydrolase